MKRALENGCTRPRKKLKSKRVIQLLNVDASTLGPVTQSSSLISTASTSVTGLTSVTKLTELKGRPPLPRLDCDAATTTTTTTASQINVFIGKSNNLTSFVPSLDEKSLEIPKCDLDKSKVNLLSSNKGKSSKSKKRNKKQDTFLIIILGTNKTRQSISSVDSEYCESLNCTNKDYASDSWVGFLVIDHKVPFTTYINDNKEDKAFQN